MSKRSKRRLLICGLLAITVVAYLPSLWASFVFDDDLYIRENKSIRSFSALAPHLLRTSRPVVYVTLALNYWLGDTKPTGYHLWNLGVHLVAGLVLFGLVRRTLRLPVLGHRYDRQADLIAFVAALLWLIHPLQTQAVTYTIQRCESMMGMCYLLCMYCALRAAQSSQALPWYAAAIAAAWLGMGCKEVIATAPAVILLYDRVFLYPSWKLLLRRRWLFYLSFLPAIVLVLIGFRSNELEAWKVTAGFGCEGVTAWDYLGSQPGVILHYLRLAVLPDRLCFDHWWPIARTWAQIAVPGIVVLSLLGASLLALRFRPAIGFLGLSFFFILAPTSSIIPISDLAVEHRMYLPLAPVIVLLVLGFHALAQRLLAIPRERAAACSAVLIVLVSALTVRTFIRNRIYQNPATVWANTVSVAPHNPRARVNLAFYLEPVDLDKAIATCRKATEIDPDFPDAYCNQADMLALNKNDFPGAMAVYRQALATCSQTAYVHLRCGRLLEKLGKYQEAIEHTRRMMELRPEMSVGHYRLGRLLVKTGDYRGAIEELQQGERFGRELWTWHFFLGAAWQRIGRCQEAIECYRKTIEINPKSELAQRNMELCEAGKTECELPPDRPGAAKGKPAASQPGDSHHAAMGRASTRAFARPRPPLAPARPRPLVAPARPRPAVAAS